MTETIEMSRFARVARFAAAPALALSLFVGGLQFAPAAGAAPAAQEEECEADRSDHLLGGLLTGPLTAISDLLPFTLFGEQFPVCDDEGEQG